MAIIFTSPKKRKRVIFWSITGILVFIILVMSLIIFPPQLPNHENANPAIVAELQVNLGILESEQLKNLESFSDTIQTNFSYKAKNKSGKQVSGTILANDEAHAIELLKAQELEVSEIQAPAVGKNDPFLPYYQSTLK